MNSEDQFTGQEYETLQEAETEIKKCPVGYWIDTWYESHFEHVKRSLIYNCNDIDYMNSYYKNINNE